MSMDRLVFFLKHRCCINISAALLSVPVRSWDKLKQTKKNPKPAKINSANINFIIYTCSAPSVTCINIFFKHVGHLKKSCSKRKDTGASSNSI